MPKVQFEDKEFELSELSEDAQSLILKVQYVDNRTAENRNLLKLLRKAKSGYMSDLKSEILTAKSGFNFLDD